jgi:hypothetical protein
VCTGYGSADRGHEAEADPADGTTRPEPSPAAAVNEPHAGGLRFLGGMVIPWTGQGEAVTTTAADGSVMGAADGSSLTLTLTLTRRPQRIPGLAVAVG